jgi:GT2 family glycosyltransferase
MERPADLDMQRAHAQRRPEARLLTGEVTSGVPLLANALTLRRGGVHFALALSVADYRPRAVREQSRAFCAAYSTWDEVRLMLDEFAHTLSERACAISDAGHAALVDAMRLSDAIVVRSWAEKYRLAQIVDLPMRDVEIFIQVDSTVPRPQDSTATDIVVYAPRNRADELAPFVTALTDLALPVTIVALDQPKIEGSVRFEPPERAAAALGRARVIVDANEDDPGTALALARLGRPLVVSSSGGASEFLRGSQSYHVWDRRSILAAVVTALSAPPPTIRGGPWARKPRRRAQPVFQPGAPLVTVVVATYNRPKRLEIALSTIQRQSYPEVEIIVVNDGGCDVSDIVSRFSRARLIENHTNAGPAAARNLGLRAARGTFLTCFDDDDEMFPDHVSAHVSALQWSGFDVAYGQLINSVASNAVQGGAGFVGQVALLDHADIQWAGSLAPTAFMFRRTVLDEVGLLDESLEIAEDYDFWLRVAQARECARVDEVTSMYFVHNDGSNYSGSDAIGRYRRAHQDIYAKHPSTRPLVNAGRTSMLNYFGLTAR